MATKLNSFQLQEESAKADVRSTADRVRNSRRRSRREFNGTTMHLALDPRVVEELSQEGHLYWAADDLKGNMAYLESIGYRYVTNQEAQIDREGKDPNGRVTVRYGTADYENHPQDHYLMLQPWEFYNEDMEAMDRNNQKLDRMIEEGSADTAVEREYGRRAVYNKR